MGIELTDGLSFLSTTGVDPGFGVRQAAATKVRAELVSVSSGEPFSYRWTGESHFLALHRLRLKDGEVRIGDQHVAGGGNMDGTLSFAPAHTLVEGWSSLAEESRDYVALYLDAAAMGDELADRLARVELAPRIYFRSPAIEVTMAKVREHLVAEPEPDRMFLETVGVLASIELAQYSARRTGTLWTGGLSRMQLARVLSLIEERLAMQITLAELALECGLSQYHFLRAFRQSMGETPLRYVQASRVRRATTLLRGPGSIDQIAKAVGYAGASQLGKAFTQIMGCSPTAWRRRL